ncbi:MAG: hypothetical protein P4M12_02580 [Gammaproteobacteria bacterium]|nr:hypothetical protein [Gammaproteobacteria bacterium]
MSILNKIVEFYKKSPENRLQFFILLGFFIVPLVALSLLYIIVMIFYV